MIRTRMKRVQSKFRMRRRSSLIMASDILRMFRGALRLLLGLRHFLPGEVGIDNLPGHRSGRRPAVTGVFQDDRDRNFRISVRRKADEEGMVPKIGGHPFLLARLFILREPDHLGSARLPADVLFLSFQDIPRSTLFIDHPPQGLVDEGNGLGADRQGALFLRAVTLYDMSVRRFKLFYEPGPVNGAAVGQGGIDVGELDRGHEVVPLADGEGDGFANMPRLKMTG